MKSSIIGMKFPVIDIRNVEFPYELKKDEFYLFTHKLHLILLDHRILLLSISGTTESGKHLQYIFQFTPNNPISNKRMSTRSYRRKVKEVRDEKQL